MIIGPCVVITGGPEPGVIDGAAVRVIGAHIAQVGPAGNLAAAFPDDTLWPARGRVLLPGLVNTHAHLARHLARGLGVRDAAGWRRYDRALSPDDIHWATQAALVEGIRHGVTTVCDFHRSGAGTDRALAEVIEAGSRVGVRIATCFAADQEDPPAERSEALKESAAFAREIARKRSGRLRGMVGLRATTLAGMESLVQESLAAAGDRLGVHVDLALDATPAERWAGGIWSPGASPTLWAHAERAPRGLVSAVQERGDTLTATGTGAAAALAREAGLGWGSDTGLNAPPVPDAAQAWGGDRRALYERLFVNGADWAAAHFGPRLGSIAPGAPADLQLVDYRPATEFNSETLLDHLWTGLLRAPVSGVMVAGEILLDHGQLVTIDEGEVAERARECARRVWRRLS
jgi:cytosine/adenosine deaminase-related metal-dependent hydrolase